MNGNFSEQYVDEACDALRSFAVREHGLRLTEDQRVQVREAIDIFLASSEAHPMPAVSDIMREHETHCGIKHRSKDAFIGCNQRHALRMEREYQRANPEK